MLRLTRRHVRWGMLAGLLCLLLAVPPAATAQENETVVVQEGSWFERTLKKFFGGRRQEGEELAGAANQMVDRYVGHIDKTIEVVIVHQVDTFDSGWDRDKGSPTRLFNRLSGRVHSYTQDSLIRQYLLFQSGDKVDPFLLADSERMLRNLEFINDVRILIVPLEGTEEAVAIVVETRDRWPFGITGKFKDVDWFEGSFLLSNIGGQGIRFDNKILYRRDFEPELGYRGTLSKQNIAGTFIRVDLEYEDSWRELRRYAGVNRNLEHPGIILVGGIDASYTDDRNNGDDPRKFKQVDGWLGHTTRLDERPADQTAARKVLVPAVRIVERDWVERPYVAADTAVGYHDLTDYMASVTFQNIKNYKTSYLYRMGEVENIPSGPVLKLTGGYEDGEFNDRTFGFLQGTWYSVRNRGDIIGVMTAFGGFFRDHHFEDGLVDLKALYISRLFGEGGFRHRFYSRVEYLKGINRWRTDGLTLGDRTGLTELDNNRVEGDQRLLARMESRVFTPWKFLGFHFMMFGFLDTGTVGGEDDPILKGKWYASGGLGLRLDNPDLVLETFQIRASLVNNIEDQGATFALSLGNPDYPPLIVPGVKPGLVGYQ